MKKSKLVALIILLILIPMIAVITGTTKKIIQNRKFLKSGWKNS